MAPLPISVPMNDVICELCAPPDAIAFTKLLNHLVDVNERFVPLDPQEHNNHHGLLLADKDARAILSDPCAPRYTALLNAVTEGRDFDAILVEFAQWKAWLRMEPNGQVIVTRKLRIVKRENPEDTVVMLICPGHHGTVYEFHSKSFHDSPEFEDKGEYIESVQEGEMGAEDFSEFIDTWIGKGLYAVGEHYQGEGLNLILKEHTIDPE